MSRQKCLVAAIGVAIVTASLAMSGVATSSASANPAASTSQDARTANRVADPNARHAGTVAGLQSGSNIKIPAGASPENFHKRSQAQQKRVPGGTSASGIAPIHPSLGTSFNGNSVGATAVQSVSTTISSSNSGTWLYTPTLYPSGGACIEMTTAYTPNGRLLWAWDWCQTHNVARQIPIDANFMATYALDGNYTVQISKTDAATNLWTAYLFNWKKKLWETFYQQKGTSSMMTGWDSYEIYSNVKSSGTSYACGDLQGKRLESNGMTVKVAGKWVAADPANSAHIYDSPLSDFRCRSLKYSMITPYSHWKAIG